jgi:hypothetical protein
MHRWITTIKATGLKYYTLVLSDGSRFTHSQGVEDFNKNFFKPAPYSFSTKMMFLDFDDDSNYKGIQKPTGWNGLTELPY